MKKIVMLGATRGMGRSLSRLFAVRGDALFLLGRNEAVLKKSLKDLKARGAREGGFFYCDLEDDGSIEPALDAAFAQMGHVDIVVLSAGLFALQDQLEEDRVLTHRLLDVNFTHALLFLEGVKRRLLDQGGGTLCALTSVAGDRGRKPVILYGASKAGLSYYLEAMDHKYRAQGLHIVNVKPGFIKTDMTEGLKPPPFAGESDEVAHRILWAIDKGKPVVYVPWIWGWIMAVIRRLPRWMMRRISF